MMKAEYPANKGYYHPFCAYFFGRHHDVETMD
jgi:hypothetical protein